MLFPIFSQSFFLCRSISCLRETRAFPTRILQAFKDWVGVWVQATGTLWTDAMRDSGSVARPDIFHGVFPIAAT
jgi:hypothetical protein